jgi:hypothetical protein
MEFKHITGGSKSYNNNQKTLLKNVSSFRLNHMIFVVMYSFCTKAIRTSWKIEWQKLCRFKGMG